MEPMSRLSQEQPGNGRQPRLRMLDRENLSTSSADEQRSWAGRAASEAQPGQALPGPHWIDKEKRWGTCS